MPGFQSTRLATEGALEPFFFLYTDDSIQGNPETCKQSSITLNYEVKNNHVLLFVILTVDNNHKYLRIHEILMTVIHRFCKRSFFGKKNYSHRKRFCG